MEHLFNLFYECSGISTDTRKIEKDCLFICLKGANFNGNTFAEEALNQGAKYVIIDEIAYKTSDSIFHVDDALTFLQQLANYHRNQFDIPVIGITGSNGKTSTKELVQAVLSEHYNVLATIGNLNNHIGVPLTLLRLNDQHEIAIIEMGANKFGDIRELCSIAEPNYGIITNIGKAHLEGFIDFEGVLKTKKELYDAVEAKKGLIVINQDDPVLMENRPKGIRALFYGKSPEADVSGELMRLTPFVEMSWTTRTSSTPLLVTNLVGQYNFYNFLAAITFGVLFEVPTEKINNGIEKYTPSNNRSQVTKTQDNTLIVDCYNANPTSMQSAIESFALIDNTNKIMILGDMLELGKESNSEHQRIIDLANEKNIHTLYVGPLFGKLTNENHFESTALLIDHLERTKINDALILLKGSRGIGLEKVIEKL